MCTLAVALRSDRRWPVVVAANRDERLGRPAEGWALREPEGAPRYLAPRDLQAGGTWIGVSSRGVFAAVTNHHRGGGVGPDPRLRSRGELVPRALSHGSAEEARRALARLDAASFNPFRLLVADAGQAWLWTYDGSEASLAELAPGLHVVTEVSHDGREPRSELVRTRWPVEPDPARLREVLSVHRPGRDGTCIHGEPLYGTRSSAVLRLAATLEASQLLAAEGHPCTSPLEDRSALLAALAASP